jgi:F-type H+-transporting ATPase subunit delta
MKETALQLKKAVMDILREKQAVDELPFLIEELSKESERLRLSPEVIVITAQPISQANKMFLEKELGIRIKKDVRVDYQIDKHLKGGVIIKLGDKLYDYSLRRMVEEMEKGLS